MEKVKTVMAHSLQPAFSESSPDQKIMDFGLNQTKTSLLNTNAISGLGSILDNSNPRVLWCGDNQSGSLCGRARRVLSSRGISLGFTSVDQQTVLLDKPGNREYFNGLLKHSFNM